MRCTVGRQCFDVCGGALEVSDKICRAVVGTVVGAKGREKPLGHGAQARTHGRHLHLVDGGGELVGTQQAELRAVHIVGNQHKTVGRTVTRHNLLGFAFGFVEQRAGLRAALHAERIVDIHSHGSATRLQGALLRWDDGLRKGDGQKSDGEDTCS